MPEWFHPSTPQNIQPTPWLHPDAVAYLGKIVYPEFKVMEFGAGGSTLWFSARVRTVVSFEKDSRWAEAVRKFGVENVVISDMDVIEPTRAADLLFIDGIPVEDRAKWLTSAPEIVRDGGWIVLDNANRPEYATEREELKKNADLIHTVDGNAGKTRYLVTEFWRVHENRTEPQ